jgi:hypothetical protein
VPFFELKIKTAGNGLRTIEKSFFGKPCLISSTPPSSDRVLGRIFLFFMKLTK